MASGNQPSINRLRTHLKEILGTDSSHLFSDEFLESYLVQYDGRLDAVECALESLIEQYYDQANKDMNNLVKGIQGVRDESISLFSLPFSKKKRKVRSKDHIKQ